jgi:hypothetical protein
MRKFLFLALGLILVVQSNAGVLDGFEDGASDGSGGSTSSGNSDDDSESGSGCNSACRDLLYYIFVKPFLLTIQLSQVIESSANSPSVATMGPRDASTDDHLYLKEGADFTARLHGGYWGRDFRGIGTDMTLGVNSMLVDLQLFNDYERISPLKNDSMQTFRTRLGVQMATPHHWVGLLMGVSGLTRQSYHGYFSMGARYEYRREHWGLRLETDRDIAGNGGGFRAFYGGLELKRGVFLLDLGYRLRVTMEADPTYIQGPSVGVAVRLGKWTFPR